jgi:signal transduction histidine kinase
LDKTIRVLLFQASRELLFNMVKHSQATSATVSIERVDQEIKIVIEDNGIGFDPKAEQCGANKKGGFGLFSIQERLAYQGGKFEIDSKPGEGTRVTIVSPMKQVKSYSLFR